MSACDVDLLSQYLDGDLTLPRRVELEEHLMVCAVCRHELDALRGLDRVLAEWGAARTPMPIRTQRRISRTVQRRRRLGPLGVLGSMAPAAFGTSIAALLVLVGINVGMLYQAPAAATAVQPEVPHAIVKQTAALIRIRRTSALLGSYVAPRRPAPPPALKRIQLDAN